MILGNFPQPGLDIRIFDKIQLAFLTLAFEQSTEIENELFFQVNSRVFWCHFCFPPCMFFRLEPYLKFSEKLEQIFGIDFKKYSLKTPFPALYSTNTLV